MDPQIFIDSLYRWKEHECGDFTVRYIGSEKAIRDFERLLCAGDDLDEKFITRRLSEIVGNFAAIVEGKRWILAVADKIRSYPVFYVERDSCFCISNSARLLKDKLSLWEIDDISLLEFCMAGYVTGRETLYKFLYQLQAGEWLLWDKTNSFLERGRYYLFYSAKTRQEAEDDLVDELDQITNGIFQRIIEEVNGAPIWVPLSGGLDSRLVLCKLKQLKYDNLVTYSYGPRGNYEARAAEHVAKKMKVPWHFTPSFQRNAKRYFWSDERKRYWEFADGLYIVPNIHWIDSIDVFLEKQLISDDAVFINGQSGDFIAGNHIPIIERDTPNVDLLCRKIMQKHFSLIASFLKNENFISRTSEKIVKTIKSNVDLDLGGYQDFAKYYELWEWQERQCKRVINGQRTYDYYGFSWKLPLWADEWLYFWEAIPLKHKLQRNLFIKYVEKMDFFGLFRNFKPLSSRWPGKLILLQYLGNGIKLVLGEEVSKKYYRYLDYFSNYSYFYAPFSYSQYLKICQECKGAMPLFGAVWRYDNLDRGQAILK